MGNPEYARVGGIGEGAPGPGQVDIGGRHLGAIVKGQGAPTVIFEAGLGGNCLEWSALQAEVAQHTRTLSYDRAGYGVSSPGPYPRTPSAVVRDLEALLSMLEVEPPFILVAHSQGGLYARSYAARFPERIGGLVLLDPLSPNDGRFMELPKRLARGSGANKLSAMRTMKALGRLGILRFLKRWIVQGPPFYYYRGLNEATRERIWNDLLRADMHDAAIDEYIQSHLASEVAELRELTTQNYPVRVITHDPKVMTQEISRYGGLSLDEAATVDELWQGLMREPVALSTDGKHVTAEGSSHYPQFARPELVLQTIMELVELSR